MLVFLNGSYVEHSEAKVSVDDRGFIFGDGLYEVVRVRNGRLFEMDAHLDRLATGLRELGISEVTREELNAIPGYATELLTRNGWLLGDATIYIQITRGAAPRTHAFPPVPPSPTIYVATRAFTPPTSLNERGGTAITVPDIRWARCDVKTINLVPNVLAKQRAVDAGVSEAIFVRDGAITDGASTNVFVVSQGRVRTPPRSPYLLAGVTRRVVLELAETLGIPADEAPVFPQMFAEVDEVFLTGTTTDVLPILRVDGLQIGSGEPGPITRQLQGALEERIESLSQLRSSSSSVAS